MLKYIYRLSLPVTLSTFHIAPLFAFQSHSHQHSRKEKPESQSSRSRPGGPSIGGDFWHWAWADRSLCRASLRGEEKGQETKKDEEGPFSDRFVLSLTKGPELSPLRCSSNSYLGGRNYIRAPVDGQTHVAQNGTRCFLDHFHFNLRNPLTALALDSMRLGRGLLVKDDQFILVTFSLSSIV